MSQAEKMNTTNNLSRRAALTGLAGTAAAGAVALPAAVAPSEPVDPIFGVIVEHTAAIVAYVAACNISGSLRDPEWRTAVAVTDEAMIRMNDRPVAILTTEPTTLAGFAALLDHLGKPEFLEPHDEDDEPHDEDNLTIFAASHEYPADIGEAARCFLPDRAATLRRLSGTEA
jgi:hypothetical protein